MAAISHPSRRHASGGSTKKLLLLSFSALLIVGTMVYLRALSYVSDGLDLQMEYQRKMLNLFRDEGSSSSRMKPRPKTVKALRGEDSIPEMTTMDTYDDEEEPIKPIQIEPPPTPPWHIVSDPDDSFERIYIPPSQKSKYKNLRDLSKDVNKNSGIKHFFNPLCRHYRFDTSNLPTVSVIMTTQNEPDDWISISVESILARTPPELLVDVIVVDDNGIPGQHGLPENIRRNVDESEFEYIKSLSPKVSVIQHTNREGCARSRLSGAKAAKGEVLMFVDSHIEMLSSTWYEHLAIAIVENPRTIAMQTIDVIDDLGSKDYGAGAGPLQYGIINNE
jgi:hypothetical protein